MSNSKEYIGKATALQTGVEFQYGFFEIHFSSKYRKLCVLCEREGPNFFKYCLDEVPL
jgi:hypothetical protein